MHPDFLPEIATRETPFKRPRRLRNSASIRSLVGQTSLEPRHMILPLFVGEDITSPRPISVMPGVYQHTFDSLCQITEDVIRLGLGGVMLFGVPSPAHKDSSGSYALREDGILNQALARLSAEFADETVIMADTCLDEFTDHGHCGVLNEKGEVDNDATIALYASMAISQAQAGAHVISPSGMMDGQTRAIRQGLDNMGYQHVAILAYTAKYSSAFYGPFREAIASSLKGNRKTYQQDTANRREAILELEIDLAEGADMVMVKPAMSYLDVLSDVAQKSTVPVAAYQVSGEYSMICAAGEKGWISRDAAAYETVLSIRRAGADIVLTYFALELAQRIHHNTSL